MSHKKFFVPDAGNSATPTEDVHNALRESAIAMSDLTDALASRPQRRGPAPAPVGGVTKARQTAPSGRKAAPRVDANGQPSKRTLKACLNCRKKQLKCGGEQPSCGRCSAKGQLCRYGNTEYEYAIEIADAANEWQRQEAYARVASAPQHRHLKPRSRGPLGPFRKLAPAPALSPPHSEQINQTQSDPVQSTANLLGSDRFTGTQWTPSTYTNTPTDDTSNIYSPAVYTPSSYASTYGTPSYHAPTYLAPTYHTPTYHTPTYHTPTYHTPTYHTPTYHTPTYHTPTQATPAQLYSAQIGQNQFDQNQNDQNQFDQNQVDQSQFDQNQFDPTYFGTTLGNWDPGLQRRSQYPRLESLLDEPFQQSQHPQESAFAQREITQLPSGPLQYGRAFDSTYGPPTVQPDWIPPYVDYQNMVHPSAPIWSETDLPAQSVPWSEPVSNDFGLGSINILQTPAESSDHVDRERSLGYIENGWG